MKKYLIFIIACVAVCLLPFAGMAVWPTTASTENKAMSEFPSLSDGGNLNLNFFKELEEYFNEHFAFRNELVYADAKIQTAAFHVSNVDTVVYGKDGWLYYSSTLDDYLGNHRMSERQIYNIVHNLSLVQQYVEQNGSAFVLAVPPNKNTLYGEYMPYYNSYLVDKTHNIDVLAQKLQEQGVAYADLLSLFRSEEEVLYLKRDSHWNGKGAVMAYNCMMDALGYPHKDYEDSPVTRAKDENGDLNRMLYTFYGEKELNYKYDIAQEYDYANDVKSVEDVWIETELHAGAGTGNGTLLMFRDSFGNTLIPLIANQFEKAWFTKEVPYGLERLMEQHAPDTVIFEKVERNLSEYIKMPPIISAVQEKIPKDVEFLESDTTISMESLEYDADYFKISGSVEKALLENETDIVVGISGSYYKAYHTGTNDYEVYIKKKNLQTDTVEIEVLTKDQNNYRLIKQKRIEEEGKCGAFK